MKFSISADVLVVYKTINQRGKTKRKERQKMKLEEDKRLKNGLYSRT